VNYQQIGRGKDGLPVYKLYARFEGETYRKRVRCTKAAIDGLYREWVDRIQNHAAAKSLRLFEVIDKHLAWCAEHRRTPACPSHGAHAPVSYVDEGLLQGRAH
jgi:hypothetical protein